MKKGFTLIEMMIAITIFSMVALFLYKSYANVNEQNKKYEHLLQKMAYFEKLKKMVYLDFTLSLENNITIFHEDTTQDSVFFQTSNSIHDRINPFVAYFVKDGILYRMETLQKNSYHHLGNAIGDIEMLGKVKSFRVYKALKKEKTNTIRHLYLIDIKFLHKEILYKLIGRNQY